MSAPEPSGPLTVDRRLASRYRLVRAIARGGMAQVWEGKDEILTRSVAVKLLDPELAHDHSFVQRFHREAVLAARLTHPNIVATFDAGTEPDGTTYIVMELVRGRTLRDLVNDHGPLAASVAVGIGLQTADALAHAHGAGLVHRDIKPGNILLCDSGDAPDAIPAVKVGDFGIAKVSASADVDLTRTGTVMGTPRYLSPEQIEGHEPDARSDVYALGVVLFEMLAGTPPFDGPNEIATAVQHVHNAPPLLGRLRPGLPRDLQDLVANCLAKDPKARPQSAAALRHALANADLRPDDRYAATSAIPAAGARTDHSPTPPTNIVPSPRPDRAHRGPAIVLAGLIAAAAVVGGILVRSGDHSRPLGTPAGASAGQKLPITAASVFHLERDADHGDPRLAVDANPTTAWQSDTYFDRNFGNLRKGLGLAVTLSGSHALTAMKVASPDQDWSAQVYVAAHPGSALADWGPPVDTKSGINGDTTFNLHGKRGGAVLLWITHLGTTNQSNIAEITVTS